MPITLKEINDFADDFSSRVINEIKKIDSNIKYNRLPIEMVEGRNKNQEAAFDYINNVYHKYYSKYIHILNQDKRQRKIKKAMGETDYLIYKKLNSMMSVSIHSAITYTKNIQIKNNYDSVGGLYSHIIHELLHDIRFQVIPANEVTKGYTPLEEKICDDSDLIPNPCFVKAEVIEFFPVLSKYIINSIYPEDHFIYSLIDIQQEGITISKIIETLKNLHKFRGEDNETVMKENKELYDVFGLAELSNHFPYYIVNTSVEENKEKLINEWPSFFLLPGETIYSEYILQIRNEVLLLINKYF